MELLQWIGVFLVALVALLKASDWFINSAEKIGIYLGIPSFIVGVTIVAAGTSLPELVTSLFAVWEGQSQIVVGNVIGSNITNIMLVLGLTAIICKEIKVDFDIMNIDMPLFFGSALFLWLCLGDGEFSKVEAGLCLVGLLIFLAYTFAADKEPDDGEEKEKLDWKVFFFLILGGVLIKYGAEYTVKSIIEISRILDIGTEIVALTAVAFGTSLPEIIVSISAARKGNAEIAVGNVLGSNIFNTFAVMGIPGLIGTLTIPADMLTFGLPVMIAASAMFLVMMMSKKISRWEGYLLFLFYVFFLAESFG